MAVLSTTNWYSNSIIGVPQTGSDINVYDRHTSPRFAVGFGFERADGNKFRYCQIGAAVGAGKLVGGNTSTASSLTAVNKCIAPATATAVADTIIKVGDIGSTYIECTLSSVGKNEYAGGYITISGGTGVGYTYRIKSNTATGDPSSGNIRLELWDKIKVAIDNTSDFALVPSKHAGLDVNGTNSNVVGVLMTATTANDFAWVCTKGFCGCLQDANASTIKGSMMTASTVTAGAMGGWTALSFTASGLVPFVGRLVQYGASAEYGVVDLCLE